MAADGESVSMSSRESTRQVYRVSEVADLLGFSTGRVYDLIRRGLIPSIRFGRQVRVPIESLREILKVTEHAHPGPHTNNNDGS